MPDPSPPRKHKRRWGLYAPYILAAVAFAAWSLFWLVLRGQVEDRLNRSFADMRAAGYEASYKDLTVSGYPFRLDVEVTQPRIVEPLGWGISAPRLEAEASAYVLTHWMIVAPEGLVLHRPGSGEVAVAGQALRASVAGKDGLRRFAFEGEKVTFAPRPGAQPFAFSAADRVDLYLRELGADKAQVQWRMQAAQARRAGIFSRIAPLVPVSLALTADLDHRGALRGDDWGQSVRAWTAAGGSATVSQLLLSLGEINVSGRGGPLTVGSDGRLRGALDLSLRQGAAALQALGQSEAVDPTSASNAAAVTAARGDGGPGGLSEIQLTFEAGATTLGPVRLGPAPRIY